MMEYLQRAIIEYRNHQSAIDCELGAIPDVLGIEEGERKDLSVSGKTVIEADKMSVFCIYQAVDAFKKTIEDLPESYWRKSVGLQDLREGDG